MNETDSPMKGKKVKEKKKKRKDKHKNRQDAVDEVTVQGPVDDPTVSEPN